MLIGARDAALPDATPRTPDEIIDKQLSADQAEVWLDEFLRAGTIRVDPVSHEHLNLARQAHMLFGKGTRHRAQLNFGDCFAYRLAKSLDAPLVFKGQDFVHNDMISVLAP